MSIQLPSPIQSYVDAANRHDAAAVAACFHDDAIVVDERREIRGPEAIRQWKEHSNQQYTPIMQPKRLEGPNEEDGVITMTATVSGSFPQSPVDLRFMFTLQGDRIARLEIDF